ncbi:MAG: hypothetical protein ACYSWZ_12590 [Planctomycetota bacterium]
MTVAIITPSMKKRPANKAACQPLPFREPEYPTTAPNIGKVQHAHAIELIRPRRNDASRTVQLNAPDSKV